jgi:hypothetical protein
LALVEVAPVEVKRNDKWHQQSMDLLVPGLLWTLLAFPLGHERTASAIDDTAVRVLPDWHPHSMLFDVLGQFNQLGIGHQRKEL